MSVYAGVGSRETPLTILDLMHDMAANLADNGWILRSGGAKGADTAFESGCDSVKGDKEIFTAQSDIPDEAFELAEKFHPAWHHCSPYAKRLHARNGMIVLGASLNDPVDLVVCWTPGGQLKGGTAQALRLAQHYEIPVANLGSEDWTDLVS